MALQSILPYAHSLVKQAVHPGDLVLDATMGNGYDTLFLASLVGQKGTVLSYDIQPEALRNTEQRLREAGHDSQVRLLLKGHETAAEDLADIQQPLSAAMFNLGYLPGSDKSIITRPDTTLAALRGIRHYVKPGGIVTLVVYPGHDGGKAERDALLDEVKRWDQSQYLVLQYAFVNQIHDPPFLLAIEKKPSV